MLLIGSKMDLEAPRPKLIEILEQPVIEARVLLEPVLNEPIRRDVGSNPLQHLTKPIFQPLPANHDVVPMSGKELSVQVFGPQTQVDLEGCRPMAAILGPTADEDAININH
jgi:hypothetical protein